MNLDFSLYAVRRTEIFDRNITHNLGEMATEAGIYEALWHPDENGYKTAADITPILEKGLKDLRDRPDHYEQFNSPNGWGMYEHFVPFVEAVLDACIGNPDAEIETCT